ncbi:Cytochrome b2, mitochondrial; AltName: Full=L-lactate dehydrogenase [Cytochrome]; AltName: Full=L-lactate ferricytochrome C oxidoreductase; Short=L-LCR; Flags: Precursor [Serendipita indica DSM 11827]|nr:Cytochrome b2, mitochondrial; AltName: Full=L-lactate dehydrogenase [Cytochrome]; AltName: Full=L-lactate ferricytochrome C oxidoreductase; Short=L-LCR; Flags: Precursor [Serendipita indica DSM 11827]
MSLRALQRTSCIRTPTASRTLPNRVGSPRTVHTQRNPKSSTWFLGSRRSLFASGTTTAAATAVGSGNSKFALLFGSAASGFALAGFYQFLIPRHEAPDGDQAPVHPDSPQQAVPPSITGTKVESKDLVSYEEVQRHNSAEDCWLVIDGQVYDVTAFLDLHPGGKQVILKMAGQDATRVFKPIHPPDTLEPNKLSVAYPELKLIGTLDQTTLPRLVLEPTEEEKRIAAAREALPLPSAALNLDDIEGLARTVLTETAWAYYSSAGDDEFKYNVLIAYHRLNKVSHASPTTNILSFPSSLPIFVAPAALARLGHPGGEVNITRASAKEGIIQGISNNASCSIEEIVSAREEGQVLFFQLYMNRSRKASEELLRKVEKAGFNAIFLTVDAAVPGKRERDQRVKGDFAGPAVNGQDRAGNGVAQAISGYQDPDVCWADIPWIQDITKLPLIIKGIQCVEDAEKAYEHGVQGIVLSNHGGRQLDFSPAPITVLQELRERRPDLLDDKNFHVFVDGGVRRGTDVLKALCLGARGVGLGRPFLFANSLWGEEGVRRAVQIMREEIITGMQLLGVTSLDQLRPEMVKYVDRDPARVPPNPRFDIPRLTNGSK